MGLKPGYKRTDVGEFPADWDVLPLGELFGFKNGLNKSKEYFGHGTPIVNYMDVYKSPSLTPDMIEGRVEVDDRELNAFEVRDGDVFFTRTSETVHEVGIASTVTGQCKNTVFSGFLLRGRPKNKRLLNGYKSYCFSARYFRDQVTSKASYTTRALTTGRVLATAQVACPPEGEQRAIAEALFDVDALLASLDCLIAKKLDFKQAVMQQLLTGRSRLPGFKKDWGVGYLGKLGRFLKGSGVLKDQARSGDIACVRYGELYTHHHEVIRNFNSWISADVASSATRLRSGDILFAGSGETKAEIGKCAAFVDSIEAYAGGDIIIFRPDDCDSVFLGYFLNTPEVNRKKASRGQGDAVVHISANALSELEILLPNRDEQSAIGRVISEIDVELSSLQERRSKTAAIKTAMMQELLIGRIRLVKREKSHA